MASSENDVTPERAITKECLLKAFTHHEGSGHVVIKDFTISGDGRANEHFSSEVLFVVVNMERDGKEITRHLVTKKQTIDILKRTKSDYQKRLFLKESAFYCDIIPAMLELESKQGLSPYGPSVPSHIYSSVDDTGGIIILDDLRPEGYKMPTSPLNYDQCELVMRELAKFHALGFVLKKGDRCNLNQYGSTLEELSWVCPIPEQFIRSLKLSMKCIKTLTSDERIAAAADKLQNCSLDDLMTEQLHPMEPYALICHGDFFRNNLLFRYELIDGVEKPMDVKLIDLQLCRYAVPTTDLSYFFYLSTTRELRENKLRDLLELYHTSFTQCLKSLGVDFPEFSVDTLENLYRQRALYGVLCFYSLHPIVFMKMNNATTLEVVENEFMNFTRSLEHIEMFKSQKFIDPLEELVNMGII